jgi:type IX secretion system substrate protein
MKKKLPLAKRLGLLVALMAGIGTATYYAHADKQDSKQAFHMLETDGEDDDEPLSSSCGGTERWDVKVFTDAAASGIDFAHPHNTSVTHLVNLPTVTPGSSQARITPQEDSVYTVICNITEFRPESDSDCHLVITDGTSTMIAEVPDPGCSTVSISPKASNFNTCRTWVHKNLGTVINTSVSLPPVIITGVAYYDPPHGQSGAAPNNLELHGVISIGFYVATGLSDPYFATDVKVFPNPSNGVFNVSMTGVSDRTRLEVYNMFGQIVNQSTLEQSNTQINMTGVAKGIYLYKVMTEEGQSIYSGKLIIQ